MIMQVAMNDGGGDMARELLRRLVDAVWYLRTIEATDEVEDEAEVDVPSVRDPGSLYMAKYAAACKAISEPCNDGDTWWEDWWPKNCLWHPDDIARLARLRVVSFSSLYLTVRVNGQGWGYQRLLTRIWPRR